MKLLLKITYNCDTSPGVKDEWCIYEGEKTPQVGESGFGKTNCLNYASVQSCEFADCSPSRGEVKIIEAYSRKRSVELGLEEDPDLPMIHAAEADLREIYLVESWLHDFSCDFPEYILESRYSSVETRAARRTRTIEKRFSLSKNSIEKIIFEAKEECELKRFGVPELIRNPPIRVEVRDSRLKEVYQDIVSFFKFRIPTSKIKKPSLPVPIEDYS